MGFQLTLWSLVVPYNITEFSQHSSWYFLVEAWYICINELPLQQSTKCHYKADCLCHGNVKGTLSLGKRPICVNPLVKSMHSIHICFNALHTVCVKRLMVFWYPSQPSMDAGNPYDKYPPLVRVLLCGWWEIDIPHISQNETSNKYDMITLIHSAAD